MSESGGDLNPPGFSGQSHAPSGTPAPVPPEFDRPAGSPPAENPRARGISPSRDYREQQAAPVGEAMVRFGDGSEFKESDLRAAISAKAEADSRRATLPAGPADYRVELPRDFQAPAGLRFELNPADPLIGRARELAHARGIDQGTFSDMLGVYAATKISEQQMLSNARAAELSKLGSTAQNRVDAISTWIKARAGADAEVLVDQLQKFPHARMVAAFERIMQQSSGQGGAQFNQSGRHVEEASSGRIPGYEGMTFAQKRAAQISQMLSSRGGGRGRGE